MVFPDHPGDASAGRYYLGPAGVVADVVRRRGPEFVTGQGWIVSIDFTKAGAKAWDAPRRGSSSTGRSPITARGERGRRRPSIQPNDAKFTSFGGTAVISGTFSASRSPRSLATAARPANGR